MNTKFKWHIEAYLVKACNLVRATREMHQTCWDAGFESHVVDIVKDGDMFILILQVRGGYPFIRTNWEEFIQSERDRGYTEHDVRRLDMFHPERGTKETNKESALEIHSCPTCRYYSGEPHSIPCDDSDCHYHDCDQDCSKWAPRLCESCQKRGAQNEPSEFCMKCVNHEGWEKVKMSCDKCRYYGMPPADEKELNEACGGCVNYSKWKTI